MTTLLAAALLAIALDRFLPDPGALKAWAWYGDWAESIEMRFNGGTRRQGLYALLVALLPVLLVVVVMGWLLAEVVGLLYFLYAVFVLYLCVDLARVTRTAGAVAGDLEAGHLEDAGRRLADLTGTPVREQSEAGIAHTAIEAVLGRANILVVSPLFWFMLLGPAGAMLQRMVAILDREWGQRNRRYLRFGWVVARFNDFLNWLPARLTAFSYALMGSFEDAMHRWRSQARGWRDPNRGPLLAAGFGALHLGAEDEGEAPDAYGNLTVSAKGLPAAHDVRRAGALVARAMLFWLTLGVLLALVELYSQIAFSLGA